MKTPDFDELVGADETPAERERLRRVHELLLAAGPPEELSPALEAGHQLIGPDPFRARARRPRTRRSLLLLAAALVVAVAFFSGYVAGNRGGFPTQFAVQMRGTALAPDALATLQVAPKDEGGNWRMRITVKGLPQLPSGGYYVLYLTRNGKPIAPCGSFNVDAGATTVELNAPYKLKTFDGWIVTRWNAKRRAPGPVVLRTTRTA